MVMREHRLGFFRSCISVCHQQGRPFLASLDLPVERIEAVYHGFELRRESEVIHWRGEYHHIGGHKVRTKLPEIVVEYTLTFIPQRLQAMQEETLRWAQSKWYTSCPASSAPLMNCPAK